MAKKKIKLDFPRLPLLVISIVIIVTLIVFFVPVKSQQVQCFTIPCPPIQKTIYNLIIEAQEEAIIDYGIDFPVFEDPLTREIVEPTPIEKQPIVIQETKIDGKVIPKTVIEDPMIPETKLTYLQQLLENLGVSFTSKFGIVGTATIFDTNGDVIDETSQIIALSVRDSKGNLLDLATIQFNFNAITQEKANIIADAQIDLLLDNTVVATRQLKINSNTFENSIPFQVRDGTKIQNTLNFTLLDKGEGWVDGSLHELKLTIKNIKAQVSSGSGLSEFARDPPFTFYSLELKQDESRKTIESESGEQVAVPKKDDTVQIFSNSPFEYATSCDNAGCHPESSIWSYQGTSMTVKIKDSEGNLIDELTTPNCPSSGFPTRYTRSTSYQCTDTSEITLSRLTNYSFTIDAVIGGSSSITLQPIVVSDTFEYTTPQTQQNIYFGCNVLYVSSQTCGSNIGWKYP